MCSHAGLLSSWYKYLHVDSKVFQLLFLLIPPFESKTHWGDLHRTVQVRRDLRRSSSPTSCPKHEIRPRVQGSNQSGLQNAQRVEVEQPLWGILFHCHVVNWHKPKIFSHAYFMATLNTTGHLPVAYEILGEDKFPSAALLPAISAFKESSCLIVIEGSRSELIAKYLSVYAWKPRFLLLFQNTSNTSPISLQNYYNTYQHYC